MGSVGTAKGREGRRTFWPSPLPLPHKGGLGVCRLLHSLQIALGQDDVGVEDDEPLALCTLCSVVAALSGTAVGLVVIMQVEDACILSADILAWDCRPIFHDDDFKVFSGLPREALKEFADLIRPVEDGDDDGISHVFFSYYVFFADDDVLTDTDEKE
jgi:hypothetical protein